MDSATRDRQVLDSIVGYCEEHPQQPFPHLSELAERTGLGVDDVAEATANLAALGFLKVQGVSGGKADWFVHGVRPEARGTVRSHRARKPTTP